MSLLPFWALRVVVALLSMEGQKALRFHQKFVFQRWTKPLQVWNDMRVSNDKSFIFVWTIFLKWPYKWQEQLYSSNNWTTFNRIINGLTGELFFLVINIMQQLLLSMGLDHAGDVWSMWPPPSPLISRKFVPSTFVNKKRAGVNKYRFKFKDDSLFMTWCFIRFFHYFIHTRSRRTLSRRKS